MPRMTDDEKLATLEKRKADIRAMQLRLNRQLRAVQSRKKSKSRSDDTHRKIIAGALALEHAAKNPGTEFATVLFRLLDRTILDPLPYPKVKGKGPPLQPGF
jgi:hypothetical protein